MTFTTLTYLGTEKTLADWGLAMEGCELRLVNLEQDTWKVGVPAAKCTDDPVFPFEAIVVLRSGRTSATGRPNSFKDGLIEFQGKRLLHVVDGRPNFEGVYYTFAGPWYDIQNCPYQQLSTWYLGEDQTTNNPKTGPDLSSDVLLFFKLVNGLFTWITSKIQILDTLQHVLDQYALQKMPAPFQVTLENIDVNVPLPLYPMQDVKCAEVLEYCLRPSPDARLWFDYSTEPPTAHITSRANCQPVTFQVADGVSHESLRIIPRYDLQARSVIIFFKQTNTVDNKSWLQKTKQKYGPHGEDSALDPDGGLRVVVQTVDIAGFSQTNVYGELNCLTVTNDLAFWSVVVPELASTQVRKFAVLGDLTILDENGSPVNLAAYPRALMDGSSICSWMTLQDGTPIAGKRVTITADVSYDLYDTDATGGDRNATNGNRLESFPKKRLSWRGTLTNGVTGYYSAVAEAEAAAPILTGLAKLIYQSLEQLQYEGDVAIVTRDISGGIHMGNTLNLSNGRPEWATMNAQVQSINKDFGSGRVTVTIGPARFLSAGDLTQIFLINRQRRVYTNPSVKATGESPAASSSVSLGKNQARENTNTGLDQSGFFRLMHTQEE